MDYDKLIDLYFGTLMNYKAASIEYYLKTGTVSGTFRSELKAMLKEACEGGADSTSKKDLRVCSVNGSALFQSMGEFAYKAFPDATSIEHLKKLKIEADEAIEEPKNIVEYSDCLLALFGAAHKAGFTYDQLLEASQSKFEIVKTRNWEKLSDGTYQHCH